MEHRTRAFVAPESDSIVTRMIAAVAAVVVAASALVALAPAPAATAAQASDFDAGYLISDYAFFNGAAMSEAEIQAFLESMGDPCANSNCLDVYRVTTPDRTATTRCDGYVGAADERASRILFKIQRSCRVSAKVLLVTLQKEQGLITASAPSDSRLERAMGYYCPDDPARPGWCHPDYAGFFNQVYNAAGQFHRYAQNPSGYNFQIGAESIQYHPNTACGTKAVTIRNQATAGLYNYTPYTPNPAALANLYGTGDACSSYGNRNFWRLYTDWFGSPTTLMPSGVTTTRFDGVDRYDVSVQISRAAYPNGTGTVYVATGENFPDGLAAAPAAARVDAPILLTPGSFLPGSIATEIRRLAPSQIVVVGGPPSVSDAVYAQLAALAPAIRRDAGPDRYAAARDIARKGFPGGATTAYITRGDNFPDALSAGAAAGSIGAPILLVHPSDTSVNPETARLLQDLGVTNIVITGSTVSVTAELQAAFGALPGISSVVRQGGFDRYDAGLAINKAAISSASTAYIASGTKFPDAMSAAAVAAATGSPLILSTGDCTKTAALQYLIDAGVTTVHFLGSTATLKSTVSEFQTCG